MKLESQSDRILRVLRDANRYAPYAPDRCWKTTSQILSGAGYCSFSARVSELRKRGYRIECRRIEGASPGPDAQEYRLIEDSHAATAAGKYC